MLEKTGIPTQADIDSVFPCEKRLSLGSVAVIECYQSIPCDPCATACPRGAILPFVDIKLACGDATSGIVCRCNDLTVEDIRDYIAQGYHSIDEIKRVTRLGMGQCQGRNCIPIVMNELSRALGIPVAELEPANFRPSIKSIKLGQLAAYGGDLND